ncbi:hypothetical protein NX869_30315, partial [Burkholderia thailandensis]|uniref:hypothetical protein n=1 Tax=Burkholderia thailandensis TaxID=57975 RepID=UPI00217E0616
RLRVAIPVAGQGANRRQSARQITHQPPAAAAVACALSADGNEQPASIHGNGQASHNPALAEYEPELAFVCGRRHGCSEPRSAFEQYLAVPVVLSRASSTSKQQR